MRINFRTGQGSCLRHLSHRRRPHPHRRARAASTGVLPTRAYGTSSKILSTTFRAVNINVTGGFFGVSAMFAIITGIVVLVGAVMLSSQSHQNTARGTVIVIFSASSLIGGGGFFIGSILGILGGIIAITWKPDTPATH